MRTKTTSLPIVAILFCSAVILQLPAFSQKNSNNSSINSSLSSTKDSLSKNLNHIISKAKANTISKGQFISKALPNPLDSALSKLNLISSFSQSVSAKMNQNLSELLRLSADTKEILKNPIELSKVSAIYTSSANISANLINPNYYTDNLNVSSIWSVANIPVSVNFLHQTWSEVEKSVNVLSIKFDRNDYLSDLKKKIGNKVNPQELLAGLPDPLAELKKMAHTSLKNELQKINDSYKQVLSQKISEVGDIDKLLHQDIISLKQQFLSNDYIKSIADKENILAQLINRRNIGEYVDSAQIKSLENSIMEFKGLGDLVRKIEEHKTKWNSSGLIGRIKQYGLAKENKLNEFINDPGTVSKIAKKHLNLSSLQRLFLKINKLNSGQAAQTSSPLTMSHFLNKGIMTEFLNNNKYLMLLNGKIKDHKSINDYPFVNDMASASGAAKAIRFGSGNLGSSHSHVSVMSFDQAFTAGTGFSTFQPLWRTLVTTISKRVSIGEKGMIMGEISKSATTFLSKHIRDSAFDNRSGFNQIFSGDLLGNLAFSLKYENELPQKGLSYQVNINSTSNGYDNPGNSFLAGGSKEAGLRIRKSFLKNKIQVGLRSNFREYNFNEQLDNKWRNSSHVFDFKWRLRKGQFVLIRYSPNRMIRFDNGVKSRATSLERLSLEANLAAKVKKTQYRNYINLSYQNNSFLLGNATALNKSIGFSTYQSIVLGKKLIYFNCNFNNSINSSLFAYFNTSLINEIGVTYQLLKKISASSAFTYNSVKAWYQQAGFRQTLTGQLNDRFNLNLYVDARKTLKEYQPLLYGPMRIDISVQYNLNKK